MTAARASSGSLPDQHVFFPPLFQAVEAVGASMCGCVPTCWIMQRHLRYLPAKPLPLKPPCDQRRLRFCRVACKTTRPVRFDRSDQPQRAEPGSDGPRRRCNGYVHKLTSAAVSHHDHRPKASLSPAAGWHKLICTAMTADRRMCAGATGFIATQLVKQLLEKGYTVRGTVRSTKDERKTEVLHKLADALPGEVLVTHASGCCL